MSDEVFAELEREADKLVDDGLALYIRFAGQAIKSAERRVTVAYVGNVACLAVMGVLYLTVDGAAGCRFGLIFLGLTSTPALAAKAVAWVRRRRR